MADTIWKPQGTDKELDKYFLDRQEAYAKNLCPVVVLTEIKTADDVETAMRLWEDNGSTYMKAMFVDATSASVCKSSYELVIYEIPTEIHEVVAEFFAAEITVCLYSPGCKNLIEATGRADRKRSVGESTMQPDKSYKRITDIATQKSTLTFFIEVAWTQPLGPSTLQSSLLGKIKDWNARGCQIVWLQAE